MKKLVRDKIPEIIKEKGEIPQFYIAEESEYKMRLNEKLQEEVDEYLADENKEEIADILEVIDAICLANRFDKAEIEKIKIEKKEKRGSFGKKIILIENDN
jgi:predicted house-cleaning noncanonical NTP pyrophosphatase (MazG superfamily)